MLQKWRSVRLFDARQKFSRTFLVFHSRKKTEHTLEDGTIHNQVQEKVLEDLNSLSEEDLIKFKHVGKEKAERIASYRKEHGIFQSIEELENISGFTLSIIRSLKKDGFVERKKSHYAHILTPDEANKIKSLTSINIGRMEIVWCCLSTTYEVLDWRSAELERQKQYRPKILIENVRNILHQIPKTDINIIELQSYKSASRNPSVFPQVLHKRLTEAAIHALSPVQTYSFDPNVVKRHFSLPKSLNKQYYSMTVVNDLLQEAIKDSSFIQDDEDDDVNIDGHDGLEGAKDVVHSILSENDDQLSSSSPKNQISKKLQMPEKLLDYFRNQRQKDCLSDSLLQALTFLQLEILDRT